MKKEILERIEPLLDEVIELIGSDNTDLLTGTLLRWGKEADKENIDAMTKIGLLGFVVDAFENQKEDKDHE